MSYRLLLAGKKQDIIDNFFQMAGENFECQTTSMRKEDIDSHITMILWRKCRDSVW